MTITVLTDSALDSTDAPLVFTATDPIVSVAVEIVPQHGPAVRETVYDGTDADDGGGTFSALYAASTRDGNTWTIRRIGGWPGSAQLRIKPGRLPTPPPPLPTNGQPWGVIYQADLSTVPPQTFTTLRDYTFAGATWWLKGRFSYSGGYVFSTKTDGTGLIITGNGGMANNVWPLRWWLPLAQFAGYNPDAPVLILGRITCGSSTSVYPALGAVESTQETGDLTAIEQSKAFHTAQYRANTAPIYVWSFRPDGNGAVSVDASYTGTPLESVIGVQVHTTRRLSAVALRWSGAAPNPMTAEDPLQRGTVTDHKLIPATPSIDMSKLGASFCVAGSSATPDSVLRNIYIMQPRIP